MGDRCLEMLKDNSCSILLKILCVGHNLHHSIPHLISNMVASSTNKLQYGIDIPFVGARIFFGKNGNLEYHFFPQRVVCNFEISEEFSNDQFRIIDVTHAVE
jgi:hypothetical protein